MTTDPKGNAVESPTSEEMLEHAALAVVAYWRTRAEAAEARVKELEAEQAEFIAEGRRGLDARLKVWRAREADQSKLKEAVGLLEECRSLIAGAIRLDSDRWGDLLNRRFTSAIARINAFLATLTPAPQGEPVDDDCHIVGPHTHPPQPEPALLPFKTQRPKEWDEPQNCRQCGKPAEKERWCYAIPTCYACLPPPNIPKMVKSPHVCRSACFTPSVCGECGKPIKR
jgi:hypothetical protein